MMSSPDNKMYLNFADNLKIEQREFMSRIFLIKGEPTKNKWKLTPKQKMILNYPCLQAEQITEKDTVVAWFAPSIPVSSGPGNYVNLPGLVLAVDINHGSRTIMAKSVELKPIAEELIAKPKKGKNVTEEEFRKIVMEKRKEMRAENPDGHMMIMHRGHR
jgi:GLPGLI family protein